jgi:hypothetical protein
LWNPEQDGYHFGHGDYDIAKKSASNLDRSGEAVDAHLTYLKVVANDLVKETWDAIENVAAALLEKGTLDWDQVQERILDSKGITLLSSGKLKIGEVKRRRMLPPAGTGEYTAPEQE